MGEDGSMVDVAVIGVGQTKYGVFPEKDMKKLFVEAFMEAIADVKKGIDPKAIQEAFIGTLETGGNQLGNVSSLMVEQVHIPHIPARRVENACASSGFAFRDAYLAVKTGRYDIVMAGGVEKMTDLTRERNRYWLGVSGDVEWERLAGTNFPGIYAMIALRHMYNYGTKKEQITGVAVKNHRNAAKNPKAQLRFEITLERAMNSPMLAYPLTIFDACPTTDGASVSILCRGELAKDFTDTPIYVVASGAATDYLAIHDRKEITHFTAATLAGQQAYEEAGVKPEDIDVAEVHDCFTIAEILAYESLGFAKIGEGGRLITEGETEIGGRIAVNPSGGLKAKGHPIGATGVGQVYEITHQLRGDVKEKERQVKNAEIGLTHNVGGSGGTAVVHVLRRER
jgi:acetyl-CoA C-acetyltransferase/acetyl-CoA acyltransferase